MEQLGMFTGKKIDPDTDLYYFNSRWYDSSLGRFITEDPVKDGINWYSYVANNPMTFVDPTGLRMVKEDADEDAWWQKKEKVAGSNGRSLEVTTTQNPSRINKTTQTVKAKDKNGETVSVSAHGYDGNGQKNVFVAEGLQVEDLYDPNYSQYQATKLILSENGIDGQFAANTLPEDPATSATLDAGRYEYLTDMHNLKKELIAIPGITENYWWGEYRYKALRLRHFGTNNEKNMPATINMNIPRGMVRGDGLPNNATTTSEINDHAGNLGSTGSEGCGTNNPVSTYPDYIDNFIMGSRGTYDIFRF